MKHEDAASQVKSGLRLAVLSIAGIVTVALFFGGVAYAFFPSGHSRLLGLSFFVFSTTILVLTLDRWGKWVPGLLGYGTLVGVLAIATNHLPGQGVGPDTRFRALIVTLILAAGAVVSRRLTDRKLTVIDRIALMGFVFSMALGAGYDSARVRLTGRIPPSAFVDYSTASLAIGCLLIAWGYDRAKSW